MDKPLLKTLLTFSLILFVIWTVGKILLPFLAPIAWAAITGTITFPIYRRLLTAMNRRQYRASGLMTLAVIMLFVIPLLVLISVLAQELNQLYQHAAAVMNNGGINQLLQKWSNNPQLAPHIARIKLLLDNSSIDLTDSLLSGSKTALAQLLLFFTTLLTNSFSILMDLLIMLFVLFFIYLDGERIVSWLKCNLPLEQDLQERVFRVTRDMLSGFILGTALTCIVQGLLAGLAYFFLGVPSTILLAVLTAIGGLVPVIGTAVIWLPAAIYLYFKGSLAKAVFLAVWGLLVVGMSDNVVKPIFMSSKGSLPVLPLILGTLGGLAAFGVLGAVVGPLLLGMLYEFFVIGSDSQRSVATSAVSEEVDQNA